MSRMTCAVPLVLVSLAAGCTDRGETEAQMVVEHVQALDPYAEREDRRRLVEQLEGMDLETQDVAEVRDGCVDAHRRLLAAEDLQQEAKKSLDGVEDAKNGGELTDVQAEDIAESIQRSNEALVEASARLPKCQERVAKLGSKYEVD
ncbi:MAG: hypothetical protein ACOCV4_08040 [Myxococcota bacterium]